MAQDRLDATVGVKKVRSVVAKPCEANWSQMMGLAKYRFLLCPEVILRCFLYEKSLIHP